MSTNTTDRLAQAQAALAANPTDAAQYTELGMALFHLDRFDEALAAFQQALALDPRSPDAHNGVGRVYYHLGPPEAAIAAYSRAIELDSQYVPGYWGLGILFFAQLGAYDRAVAIFEQGLAAIPEETGFHEGLGQAYARKGELDRAIEAFATAARLDPGSPGPDHMRGIIHLRQGEYAAAQAALLRAIALNPGDGSPHRVLGFVHDRLGQADAAVAALERAVALDPADYEGWGGLARAYRAAGRPAEAEQAEARGRPLAEHDNEYGRACFAAVLDRKDEAIELLATALERKQVMPGWAQLDPELVFVQGHPRYRALLGL